MHLRTPLWPALALLAGCAGSPSHDTAIEPPALVVVYVIDTLRADRTSLYGHAEPSTPNLDALAEQSVVFDAASAPAPWTLPSVPSMLSGRFVCEHGVMVRGDKLAAPVPVVAERLSEAGWTTATFPQNAFAGHGAALDRGYGHHQRVPMTGWAGEPALEWLADHVEDRPVYLYVHTVEPHHPYTPPADAVRFADLDLGRTRVNEQLRQRRVLVRADFDRGHPRGATDHTAEILALNGALADALGTVDALYTGEVVHADRRLGAFVEGLRALGVWDDTLLVVTSDHGEELWEHGSWEHNQSLYQELIGVPLVVRLPGGTHGGVRVDLPVSGVDLGPTLLDVAGLPPWPGVSGTSLVPVLLGDPPQPEPRVVSVRMNRTTWVGPRQAVRGDDNVAVRDGRYKAIWNVDPGTVELYDLATDPTEQRDIASDERERAAHMAGVADAWFSQCVGRQGAPDRWVVDEDTQALEELRALGYVE